MREWIKYKHISSGVDSNNMLGISFEIDAFCCVWCGGTLIKITTPTQYNGQIMKDPLGIRAFLGVGVYR